MSGPMNTPGSRPAKGGLRRRMGLGAALFLGVSIASRLLALVSLAVLGRLLAPDAFGLVAYAALVAALLTTAIDRHFELSIIREGEVTEGRIDTVFTLRMIFASLVAGGMLLAAEPVALWLDTPRLAGILRAMSLVAVASGLFNPRFILLERSLSFRRVAGLEVASQAASTLIAIGLALLTRSYWAAVYGMIAASAVRTALSWTLAPGRIGLGLGDWRHCLRFSGWLVAMALLGTLNQQANRLITGALLGLAVLGRFRLGAELALSAAYFVQRPMVRVAYPALAAARAGGGDLGEAFLRFQSLLLLAIVPISVVMCVAAPWAVFILVGEVWPEAVLTLRVLALLPLLQSMTAGTNSLMLVDGRTWLSFGRQAVVFAVSLPLMWVMGKAYGLAGVLAANVAATAVASTLTLTLLLGVARIDMRRLGRALATTLAGAAVSLAAAIAVALVLPSPVEAEFAGSVAAAAAIGVTALAAHLGAVFALWHALGRPYGAERALLDILAAGRRRLRRRRS